MHTGSSLSILRSLMKHVESIGRRNKWRFLQGWTDKEALMQGPAKIEVNLWLLLDLRIDMRCP